MNNCCSNAFDYRPLCNYDDMHNTCDKNLGKFSFDCVKTGYGNGSDRECVQMNKPPSGANSYSNMRECQLNCKGRNNAFSFQCVRSGKNRQCVRMNEPPRKGTFSNIQECNAYCGLNKNIYESVK